MNPLGAAQQALGAAGGLVGGAVEGVGKVVGGVGAVTEGVGTAAAGLGTTTVQVLTAPAPPPLVAEPGTSTSEWKAHLLSQGLILAFGAAAAFGLHLPAPVQAAILAAIPPSMALAGGLYALARGIRKRGTTA